MIFAVFDLSPLTVCINCSFFTFVRFNGASKTFGVWALPVGLPARELSESFYLGLKGWEENASDVVNGHCF